jgi:hypothetical protein
MLVAISPMLRVRRRAAASLLRQLLLVLFVLALAAVPLPFATAVALARRPERRTDAVVELLQKRSGGRRQKS